MEDWDKINAVDRMQRYILEHIDEEITLQDVSRAAGYSVWHAARIFKELTGRTPFEFVRALRLTEAAKELRDSQMRVVDVALDGGFASHDGFTRAFTRMFDITPQQYRKEKPPVSYFTYYPIRNYYLYINEMEKEKMEKGFSHTVTVQAVERPARRLIVLRSQGAADYWSFCEEKGCDWEGVLNSVSEKFDTAAIVELPSAWVTTGTTAVAAGIEVPSDYSKPLPDGYEMLELPPCVMLYFVGVPYEKEEDFGKAIDIVFEAAEDYQPQRFDFDFADDSAPRFNFGATAKAGAKIAVPVRRL